MSAIGVAMPPIEIHVDEGSFEIANNQISKVISKVFDPLFSYLLQAVQEAVTTAKILASISYPPASSPGEPPHRRTGRLVDSIDIFSVTKNYIVFGADAPYAALLEFGTTSSHKIKPIHAKALRFKVEGR